MEKSNFITKITDLDHTWLTSDTHWFHENILKYCNRPFPSVYDMNQSLVDRWNSVVGPEDHVYHLGDLCFGTVEKWNWCLEPGRLNGHIHLILGNHDPERVFRPGTMIERFDSIDYQKILVADGWTIILNHFPFASFSNNFDHKVIGLSGHTHIGPLVDGLDRFVDIYKPNQYDVGCDNNNFTPISLKEVLDRVIFQIENNVNLLNWIKK